MANLIFGCGYLGLRVARRWLAAGEDVYVMTRSAARCASLVEIGSTNRTHFRDYEKAVSKETGAILVVHTSNYRVRGFTKKVAIAELSVLARKKRVPLIVDLGTGSG